MQKKQLFRFSLKLTADQYLRVYQGTAKRVSVIANDGQRIEFPAQNIKKFLTHDGISGRFEMELTSENKFVAIRKISSA
jgi:NAD+--asparagine ADP-ribosyltransferase